MKNPLKDNSHDINNTTSINDDKNDTSSNAESEGDEDKLGFKYALIWLAIIAGLIAILSEAISSTIEDGASQIGLSGIILHVDIYIYIMMYT